jgi:deoxyhypusine synthase
MRFKPISRKAVKTYSLKERPSKVIEACFATPHEKGRSLNAFVQSLPDMLAARDIKHVADAIIKARKRDKVVAMGMGGHVIKAGLGPVVIDLVHRGVVNAVAMNGACVVHDFEVAYTGKTSEDVGSAILDGSFGMAEETGRLINNAIRRRWKMGLGYAVGAMIEDGRFRHKDKSILAACLRRNVPATVHVAIGTDIIHMHPSMDGAKTGAASMRDFDKFSSVVASLGSGVYLNVGSAVVMPEVFLKALSLARNLGHRVKDLTTVNMDFIQHYRPVTNVVKRPTIGSGRGITITGHHEIMLPLLSAMVIEGLDRT